MANVASQAEKMRERLQDSVWYKTAPAAPETESLESDIDTEVCVIGAGYTGLSAGIHIAELGGDVVVVEAEEAGFGGSGRNSGHCTPTFHSFELEQFRRMIGEPFGSRMVQMQCDSANFLFELVRKYRIECDAIQSGYVEPAHSKKAFLAQEKKVAEYNALGKNTRLLNISETEELTGSPRYFGGWFHPEGGNLNPLAYCRGLVRTLMGLGGRIYTATPAVEITRVGSRWRVKTPKGQVMADKVICASGAYSAPSYWPGMEKTYVMLNIVGMATQPLPREMLERILPHKNTVLETRHDPASFRLDRDGRLVTSMMLEGRRGGDEGYTKELLTARFRWLLPQLTELRWEHYWHGRLDMQPRLFPRLFGLAPGVAAVNGYSGRGVATGTMMGKVLANWATGIPRDELAVPLEPLRNAPRLMKAAMRIMLPYLRFVDQRAAKRDGLNPPLY
ncbi:FAD-binding oxidoreductase [Caballeronia sp. SEWSISQ10-4 2]|uniref:NAD(P)/FAD-dependent oxidoreductase n=1 Tax=Caballeronia sp. SEWSISQ10-4 2 TaxID=2937438 RepID=UPI00265197C9|nr:FAD-binding oxidoreductase [Caballeronia sp. SEWSISQ10-4 2]MDN7177347.1 FAD-binding oxidoreductase [Caballeronia sp. SEWSISQ10-4 2]